MTPYLLRCFALATLVAALAGCATLVRSPADAAAAAYAVSAVRSTPPVAASESSQPAPSGPGNLARAAEKAAEEPRSRTFLGTGNLVKPVPATPPERPVTQAGAGVSLNFENADLREVVRSILGDVLNANYLIDPQVQGSVTIRTSREVPRNALLATLETLLRMNGHTMIEEAGLYKIVPAAAAVRGNITPQLGSVSRPLPAGYSVLIVPLRFVGVRDLLRILEPFAKDAQAVRVDELRNLLVLSGTERELRHMLEIIDMFDVDWVSGMSVGLFTLQSADVRQVAQEIDRVMGDRNLSPLTGILRIIPIERMNALLVISPQARYVEEAKKWIERLDRGGEGTGQRLYVYQMKNGRAEKIAPLLQQAFTGRPPQSGQAPPQLAPGQAPALIGSPIPTFQNQIQAATGTPVTPGQPVPQPGVVPQTGQPGQSGLPPQPGQPPQAATGQAGVGSTLPRSTVVTVPSADGGLGIARNMQVVADKDNNALLIVATPAEYALIEAALKKLDIAARQVMIEMTIAEVILKDEFDFGVEWYFSRGARLGGGVFRDGTAPGNIFGARDSSGAAATGVGIGPRVPGLSVLFRDLNVPGGIGAALSALASNGKTKIISNPHIIATDNQKASIKVGDRIPITQQTVVGNTTNAVTTTSQYLDTGILVSVLPHINSGGLVTLEIQAEVSDAGTFRSGEAPPINTRSAQTQVSVQSGETMILGGLIRENRGVGTDGLPILSEIPLLGALFGTQSYKNNRTELVLFITPRVIDTELDMRSVTDELRRKMEWIDANGLFPRPVTPSGDNSGGRP